MRKTYGYTFTTKNPPKRNNVVFGLAVICVVFFGAISFCVSAAINENSTPSNIEAVAGSVLTGTSAPSEERTVSSNTNLATEENSISSFSNPGSEGNGDLSEPLSSSSDGDASSALASNSGSDSGDSSESLPANSRNDSDVVDSSSSSSGSGKDSDTNTSLDTDSDPLRISALDAVSYSANAQDVFIDIQVNVDEFPIVKYTVAATNINTIEKVLTPELLITLGDRLTYVPNSATVTKGVFDESSMVWSMPQIGPGKTKTLTFSARYNLDYYTFAPLVAETCLSSVNGTAITDPAESQKSSCNCEVPGGMNEIGIAWIDKWDNGGSNSCYWPGEYLYLTMGLAADPVCGSKDVIAQVQLPENTEYVSYTSDAGAYDPQTGRWTIGLVPGQSSLDNETPNSPATINFLLKIKTSAQPGDVMKAGLAVLSEDGQVYTDIGRTGMSIQSENKVRSKVKIDIVADKSVVYAGEDVTYTITLSNPSDGMCVIAVPTENDLSNLVYKSSSASVGSYDPNTHLWTMNLTSGDKEYAAHGIYLEAGESQTLTITYTVPSGTAAGTQINNIVSINTLVDSCDEDHYSTVELNYPISDSVQVITAVHTPVVSASTTVGVTVLTKQVPNTGDNNTSFATYFVICLTGAIMMTLIKVLRWYKKYTYSKSYIA